MDDQPICPVDDALQAFTSAVYHDDIDSINQMLKGEFDLAAYTHSEKLKAVALSCIVHEKSTLLQLLIDNGLQVIDKYTMWSVAIGHIDELFKRGFLLENVAESCGHTIIQILMNYGIDPNITDAHGRSVLYNLDNVRIIKYFISLGGNAFIVDDEGKSPYDVANQRYQQTLKTFEEYSSQDNDETTMSVMLNAFHLQDYYARLTLLHQSPTKGVKNIG